MQRQRRVISALAVTAALAIAIAGAACGSGAGSGERRPPQQATATLAGQVFMLSPDAIDGTVFFSGGPLEKGRIVADLYKWPGGADHAVRLTQGGVLGPSFSVRGRIVVAAVDQAIRSEVVRLDPRRLNRLPLPRIATGLGAALSPGGKLAYDAYRERRGRPETVVYTSGLRGRNRRLVHRGGVVEVQWAPNGRLLVQHRRAGRQLIAVYRGQRRERTIPVPSRSAYRLHVSPRGDLALGVEDGFIVLEAGRRRWHLRRAPWRPLCWSPDGVSMLAVHRQRGDLAVLSPHGAARSVGKVLPGMEVGRCQWTPEHV